MTLGTVAAQAEFVSLASFSDRGLVDELLGVRRRVACLEARSAALLAEVERRGIPVEQGFGSATRWLMARTGDPAGLCAGRVQVARSLRHMPRTREAFASGEVSEARVRLLTATRDFAPTIFSRDEGLLVGQACTLPSTLFPRALAHWRRLADPDGALAEADRAFERRRLHISATWQGMVRPDGDLDPESGQTVLTALGSLTEPQAPDPADRRTPAQRRADALVEICRRHLDDSQRPRIGGEKPHLVVTVSLDQLRADGLTDLETGPIHLETVRRWACDATLTPCSRGATANRSRPATGLE